MFIVHYVYVSGLFVLLYTSLGSVEGFVLVADLCCCLLNWIVSESGEKRSSCLRGCVEQWPESTTWNFLSNFFRGFRWRKRHTTSECHNGRENLSSRQRKGPALNETPHLSCTCATIFLATFFDTSALIFLFGYSSTAMWSWCLLFLGGEQGIVLFGHTVAFCLAFLWEVKSPQKKVRYKWCRFSIERKSKLSHNILWVVVWCIIIHSEHTHTQVLTLPATTTETNHDEWYCRRRRNDVDDIRRWITKCFEIYPQVYWLWIWTYRSYLPWIRW